MLVSVCFLLAGCGEVVPGNDWVKCSCLFGPVAYNVDICTNEDSDPGSPAYEGSDVHRSCVAKCGEEIWPLAVVAASSSHTVMRGGTCDAGDEAYGARFEPLMGADGPDTINLTIDPSSSRAVLRNVGSSPVTFMLLPHWAQRNGITVPAGHEVVFMANVDGDERWRVDTTTSSQSLALVRFGSTWHATYSAELPIPETNYVLALELWFNFPLDVPPIVYGTIPMVKS